MQEPEEAAQTALELPGVHRFFISEALCPHCARSISDCGVKSLHTITQVFLALNIAAIDLRKECKLTSVRYALVLIMCEQFTSFNAMTRVLFGKYNAANAEMKQMRKLVADGYIIRHGKPGKRSAYRLTIKGRGKVHEVLKRHKLM